jgi:HlyD family secretion protein
MKLKMKQLKIIIQVAFATIVLSACQPTQNEYDATGSFEAIERTISAEATGKIKTLNIEEGQVVKAGEVIGSIDVSQLTLQGEQIQSSINAIDDKTNNASAQISILKSQLQSQKSQAATTQQKLINLEKEVNRFQKLVDANAVPQKQLDDLIGQKLVLQKQLETVEIQAQVIQAQIDAAKYNVNLQNRAILSEVEPNEKRLAIIEKQIKDGMIINEFDGTITTKLAYDGEFTSIGRPLYKVADLSHMTLRAYISGNQLAQVKLNQEVIVRTDDGQGGFKETQGTITWISSKAEFTPKTIQTKDERANLVYAIKINVANDGYYKIGMYGEIKFL